MYSACMLAKKKVRSFNCLILNELKNRGVKNILIACVDSLTGFPQTIKVIFPEIEIQQCIIYQMRRLHWGS